MDNGDSGSQIFVQDWLIPFLKENRRRNFGGAIILDSVTTASLEPGSQELPDGFDEVYRVHQIYVPKWQLFFILFQSFPSSSEEIQKNEYKGDFIGLLHTKKEQNNTIVNTLTKKYNRVYENINYFFLILIFLQCYLECEQNAIVSLTTNGT